MGEKESSDGGSKAGDLEVEVGASLLCCHGTDLLLKGRQEDISESVRGACAASLLDRFVKDADDPSKGTGKTNDALDEVLAAKGRKSALEARPDAVMTPTYLTRAVE